MKITIIGTGNIGSSLLGGLLNDKTVNPTDIAIADIKEESLLKWAASGVRTYTDNSRAVEGADIVFLCVKPWLVCDIAEGISNLKPNQIVVSFAAGVKMEDLSKHLKGQPLCRVIPNTAMAVNATIACLAPAGWTTEEEIEAVSGLLSKVGKVMRVKEEELDAATILGSCGTAFALRYIRANIEAGVQIGLRPEIASTLVSQAMVGAAEILFKGGRNAEEEIDKVTTPGGSTIRGLNAMEKNGFSAAVISGILEANSLYNK